MPRVCGKCKAPIRFGKTKNGKFIPLNIEPDPKGNIRLDEFANATYLKKDDPRDTGDVYMPHHASCPFVEAYR